MIGSLSTLHFNQFLVTVLSNFLFIGFIYWRLLSTDPAAAKEVVLAEKPLISEETDLIEPTFTITISVKLITIGTAVSVRSKGLYFSRNHVLLIFP